MIAKGCGPARTGLIPVAWGCSCIPRNAICRWGRCEKTGRRKINRRRAGILGGRVTARERKEASATGQGVNTEAPGLARWREPRGAGSGRRGLPCVWWLQREPRLLNCEERRVPFRAARAMDCLLPEAPVRRLPAQASFPHPTAAPQCEAGGTCDPVRKELTFWPGEPQGGGSQVLVYTGP